MKSGQEIAIARRSLAALAHACRAMCASCDWLRRLANASSRALDHFMGSAAFIHTARIGHICVPEMQDHESGGKRETGRYLFTNVANNIAAKQPTLAYKIEVVEVGYDAKGKIITA